MNTKRDLYTIRQLADLAGISVRTLHHYDHSDLLKPCSRSRAGYRLYGETELLRLQQILFYRELDVPLGEIGRLLDQPGFDPLSALENHRRMLQIRTERLVHLMETVDKTIAKLREETMELSDEELYEGFSKDQSERYDREARQQYGAQQVDEANKKVRAMTKAQWQMVKAEGGEVTRLMAEVMPFGPGSPEAQALAARHHAWIENFYPCPAEIYRGLGRLYVENEEFRANYECVRPGLAAFMRAAMEYYCAHTLGG